MSIEKIFTDPSFRSSSTHCYPNRLYGDGKKIGAVVVLRGQRGDFALGVAGLEYVVQAETEGRIKQGFVVLAKQNGGAALEFIAAERVAEVEARLRDLTPWNGRWGAYFWVTANFQQVSSSASADAPF